MSLGPDLDYYLTPISRMRKIPEIELEGMSRKLTIVLNDMKYNPSLGASLHYKIKNFNFVEFCRTL